MEKVTTDQYGYIRVNGELLHRRVCREKHGDFPVSWHVHHVDGKKRNNKAENLIALPPEVHTLIHIVFEFKELPKRKRCAEIKQRWEDWHATKKPKKIIRKIIEPEKVPETQGGYIATWLRPDFINKKELKKTKKAKRRKKRKKWEANREKRLTLREQRRLARARRETSPPVILVRHGNQGMGSNEIQRSSNI